MNRLLLNLVPDEFTTETGCKYGEFRIFRPTIQPYYSWAFKSINCEQLAVTLRIGLKQTQSTQQ